MATHPQIQVVDRTDEDFFDKLVDDDFPNSELVPILADGDVSDEANELSSLRFDVHDSGEEVKAEGLDAGPNRELFGDYAPQEINSPFPSDSFGDDNGVESKNGISDIISDSSVNPGSESSSSVVKEVQWSLFSTDAPRSGSGGFDSYSDFFNKLGDNSVGFLESAEENINGEAEIVSHGVDTHTQNAVITNSLKYGQNHDCEGIVTEVVDKNANAQCFTSNQDWDSVYPGWKYDPNTAQWYQVGGLDGTENVHQTYYANSTDAWKDTNANSDASYLQQTIPFVAGTVVDSGASKKVSYLNHASQECNNYSGNMVFDPQYPGWYYDTVSQEWRALDTNTLSIQQTTQYGDHQIQNGFNTPSISSQSQIGFNSSGIPYENQIGFKSSSIPYQNQNGIYSQDIPSHNHGHRTYNGAENPSNNGLQDLGTHRQDANSSGLYGGNFNQKSLNTFQPESINNGYTVFNENQKVQDPHFSSLSVNQLGNYSQKHLESGHQFSQDSNVGRSSAGRPPHALVTFGFGGKLIVMNENSSSSNKSFGIQDHPVGGSITVHNIVDIATEKTDTPSVGMGTCNYFRSLCQQSIPGPLVGGNAGSRELNKWIDERILNSESPGMDYKKSELLRLLLSLLKIACQHYGKLRSPFGTDATLRESESPELEVAKLFTSAKRHGGQFNAYGAVAHCLQNFPSEGHIRATAAEVQNHLVSGRTKEALYCAQEGQLWGPALVLAAQLGDQFYVDTVRKMAFHQLAAGSPLRTLCLLIAGHQADVFKTDAIAENDLPMASNLPRESGQPGINVMLDDWKDNLAVVTANRTKEDELVIINLGDALWRERSEIIAAHICYLIAESDFEQYSDRARLCLIGADHLKFPRTFASPEAIQRTELYEYSKVLGNSQFILLPFQPYKIIYAHMLAEVGKVSDALKYCQAVLKSIKMGRSPEVERSRQSVLSLEERLKTHQQGGFTANLAPAKLVGKFLNLFDSTAHRVVGGGLPPMPPASQTIPQNNGHFPHKVSTSHSTVVMSSLIGSASVEPVGENPRHNRSVSEPDFGRTPIQAGSSKEAASGAQENKGSVLGASSRFVGFGLGSQFFQKTMGLVLRRSDRQAKLGEKNKFYYHEKLKRWVEEGAEAAAEETVLPPPPTASAFQNGMPDYNLKRALKNEGSPINQSPESPAELSSGIPPIPPTSNQFSARGRTGVRSRYVDTFHHGNDSNSGMGKKLFQSPSPPPLKSLKPNLTHFIPKAAPVSEDSENHPYSSSLSAQQRFPSMSDISSNQPNLGSRRTASWSGNFPEMASESAPVPLGEALGMQDLHEVEL